MVGCVGRGLMALSWASMSLFVWDCHWLMWLFFLCKLHLNLSKKKKKVGRQSRDFFNLRLKITVWKMSSFLCLYGSRFCLQTFWSCWCYGPTGRDSPSCSPDPPNVVSCQKTPEWQWRPGSCCYWQNYTPDTDKHSLENRNIFHLPSGLVRCKVLSALLSKKNFLHFRPVIALWRVPFPFYGEVSLDLLDNDINITLK